MEDKRQKWGENRWEGFECSYRSKECIKQVSTHVLAFLSQTTTASILRSCHYKKQKGQSM